MPLFDFIPLPQIRLTLLLLGKRCFACRITTGFLLVRFLKRFSTVSRSAPFMIATPILCVTPSTENRACSRIDGSSASVSRTRTKAWLSSISVLPGHGRCSTIAGPPVSKLNACRSVKALPASVFRPARILNVHRLPAGKSLSKSNDQLRLSIHRAVPCAPQSTSNGDAVSRGSPSGTIGSENRAVTCRTCFTVPCGEKRTTDGDAARERLGEIAIQTITEIVRKNRSALEK